VAGIGLDVAQAAELAAVQYLLYELDGRKVALIESSGYRSAVSAGAFENPAATLHRGRQWLLAKRVLSRFEGRHGDLFMEMRRRRDDDGVYRAFAKHSPMIFERIGAAGARRGPGSSPVGVGNRYEGAASDVAQRRGPQPPNLSRTDQAKPHYLHSFRLAPTSDLRTASVIHR
jgi:hypothetical protein